MYKLPNTKKVFRYDDRFSIYKSTKYTYISTTTNIGKKDYMYR